MVPKFDRLIASIAFTLLIGSSASAADAVTTGTSFVKLTPVAGSTILLDPSKITAVANLPYYEANARVSGTRSRERPAGVTPPTLPCNCRFVGPVPLHSAFNLFGTTWCRPTPLHAGTANPYQGRLRLRSRHGSDYPLV